MTRLRLSRPLQAVLLGTFALTVVALLKPDAVEVPRTTPGLLQPPSGSAQPSEDAVGSVAPWVRLAGEEWKLPVADKDKDKAAVVPTPAPPSPPPPTAQSPIKPSAPDPAMAYLGRIEQDGHHYVFLGRTGAGPVVVEIGSQVDAQWKVERASTTEVELRYLPLDEVRLVTVQ